MIGQPNINIGRYISNALIYYEQTHPGKAMSYAKQDKDIVPEIAQEYFPQMDRIPLPILGIIKGFIQSYDVHQLSKTIIHDTVKDFESKSDELGLVAREYPEWMRDQLRRLVNLAILYLGGNANVSETANSIRNDK